MARIRVVESEPDLRSLAEQALTELGHEPVAGTSAPQPSHVDALLIDGSPDAVAVARAMRRHDHRLPIICLSTRELCPPNVEGAGPVVHLVKPYRLAGLARALARALAPGRGP